MNEMTKPSIGMIVAIETEALFSRYPTMRELDAPSGFQVFCIEKDNCVVYVVKTGMGEIAASAGVQYLAAVYHVSFIINFGVVGGLTEAMGKAKVCLVERVVHYKYDCSEFMDLAVGQVDGHDSIYLPTDAALADRAAAYIDGIPRVTCCSGDKFVGTAEEKAYLHTTFGGDICDMESAGIVLACEMNGLPCLLLKAVSDGLADGADGFYRELSRVSALCLDAADRVMDSVTAKA